MLHNSNAIAYYLLRKYAPESELYPSCYKERARIGQVLTTVAYMVHRHLLRFQNSFVDTAKFPKMAAYCKRVEPELTYFEEV
ncbi:hypothetical protein V5799_018900 [Amblyomma americanum]|uniref:Glutathione s-transferase n=1 Tax=Amblyomma americanum TaxID=6943 RepID=A0AAQ4EYE3_AMBAM